MLDISNKEELTKYLLDKKLISDTDGYSINYCKGGVSGTVAFVYAKDKPMIIKQALAQLKTKETWLCDPNRMKIEYESNAIYHRLIPENAPEVYFYDDKNYVYGREAAPESCTMWKSDLLSGLLDYEVARKAIESLVIVHNECAADQNVAELFADKNIFYELRISPYIEFIVKKYPLLSDFAGAVSDELMNSKITLVHGDYSPKNIMINGRKICILDYEVAHFGHPAFDLAFFSNHIILKSVKNKQWSAAYINMLTYMLDIYFDQMNYMDKKQMEASFVKTLSLLMIARVDGKSPAEYITLESDKELIRKLAFEIINKQLVCYADVKKLLLTNIAAK
jgi:5-methylthioribose kinase